MWQRFARIMAAIRRVYGSDSAEFMAESAEFMAEKRFCDSFAINGRNFFLPL